VATLRPPLRAADLSGQTRARLSYDPLRRAPLDSYGRNIYLDTFNSRYGGGWERENSFVAHRPTGVFCYMVRPGGRGKRYRATVIGPGVTPDIVWEGVAPGAFDEARDAEANEEQRQMRDRLCRPN
jgi:hypothetical protein